MTPEEEARLWDALLAEVSDIVCEAHLGVLAEQMRWYLSALGRPRGGVESSP